MLFLQLEEVHNLSTAAIASFVKDCGSMPVFLACYLHASRMGAEKGKVRMVIGILQYLAGSYDAISDFLLDCGAVLDAHWGRSFNVNLDVKKGVDKRDVAIISIRSKGDAISSYEDEISILMLNAPVGVLHEMDHKAAEDPGTSTTVGESKQERSSGAREDSVLL